MGWMRALFRRGEMERGMESELQLHIELQAEEYVKAGMAPDEARVAAERRLGRVAPIRERCRDENGAARVETLRQDLRFGARTLLAQPGFSATALLTLALGIGANTAIFSVLRATLLEPLPLPEPERVMKIFENDRLRGTTRENASFPDFLDMRQQARSFERLAALQMMNVTMSGRGETERLRAARVTASYFDALGLRPAAGRFFGAREDGVVLSHALWLRKFRGANGAIGSVVQLDGFPGTVVGVAPPEVSLQPDGPELWSSIENVRATQSRGQHTTQVFGRLRRGVSVDEAQSEMSGIMMRLEKEYPKENLGRGARVVPLHEELAGNLRPALKALGTAVGGVLLIACVNIASLLLARSTARHREMAVRMSLGAGRGRLIRQLLTESLLLSLLGGALGVAGAYWGVKALIAIAPPNTPLIDRARVDGAALAATFGICLFAWLIFGLLPAVRTSVAAPASALQPGGRGTVGRDPHRLLNGLVVVEVALAVVLVISAGLMLRSFWRLRQADLGYDPSGMVGLRFKLPERTYPWPKWPFREWPAVTGFHSRLKDRVLGLPGVESASLAMAGPAQEMWTTRVHVDGRPVPPEGEMREAQFRTADIDYLRVSRARLARGRFFEKQDDEKHPLVGIVNEAFVREHFPGEDPIGRRILVFGGPREVVGVIGDIRYLGPGVASPSTMYFPLRQTPFPDGALIVRAKGDATAVATALRRAVLDTDPNVAPFDVMTLGAALAQTTARERFVLNLLTGFGALAVLMAVVGIYGVVSYAVARRRREIGMRIAVGARPSDIFRQVTGGTVRIAGLGVAAGLILAAITAPALQPLVFETSTRDTNTYAAVAVLLFAVAFCAAALPARRAALLDPAVTLREE
jgi:predicted permease